MKIVVVGAGGVGGYFGARLAAAGHAVAFIARGTHLAAIRDHGLTVLSALGDTTVAPATAGNDAASFGPADIILFCVKAYDTALAADLVRPCIGPETGVIPLLNGIEHIALLQERLGVDHVLGGVANISALIEAPGVIRHYDTMQILRIGELDDRNSERVQAFRTACGDAGIDAPVPNNIERELWQKLVMICTLAGANCLTRLPLGPCRTDPATRMLMQTLALEVVTVAGAVGASLPDDQVDRTMAVLEMLPAPMKASMLAALERGERLEASALNGAVDRLGRANGIDTPVNRTVYAALAPYEHGHSDAI